MSFYDECPACRDQQITHLDFLTGNWQDTKIFSNLKVALCQACGFGWAVPSIDQVELDEFYTSAFRKTVDQTGTLTSITSIVYHFRSFLQWTRPKQLSYSSIEFTESRRPSTLDYQSLSQLLLARCFVGFKPGDTFVDIGPGHGLSFNMAQVVFPQPRLVGVELSEGAAESYARLYGASTYNTYSEYLESEMQPTVVLSSHVLEHMTLESVNSLLRLVRDSLVPDGIFVVEVPNCDLRMHYHTEAAHAPHILFFSSESLQAILERAGFTVLFLNSNQPRSSVTETDTRLNKRNELLSNSTPLQKNLVIIFLSGAIKTLRRSLLRLLPWRLQNPVSIIFRRLVPERFHADTGHFEYGGDGSTLRAVVTVRVPSTTPTSIAK